MPGGVGGAVSNGGAYPIILRLVCAFKPGRQNYVIDVASIGLFPVQDVVRLNGRLVDCAKPIVQVIVYDFKRFRIQQDSRRFAFFGRQDRSVRELTVIMKPLRDPC